MVVRLGGIWCQGEEIHIGHTSICSRKNSLIDHSENTHYCHYVKYEMVLLLTNSSKGPRVGVNSLVNYRNFLNSTVDCSIMAGLGVEDHSTWCFRGFVALEFHTADSSIADEATNQ